MKEMGKRLLALRKQVGLTQKQVCDAIGLKENQYRHYEKDTGNPHIKTYLGIVELLQTSAEYLACGRKNDKPYKVGEWEPFPERLRKIRRERKLKQEQVAEILGIYRESYWSYESGRFEPKMEHLYSLKNLFGVSMDELLGRIEEEE